MARMPSRVFAAILIDDDGQLTAAELAEQLRVSTAAISGALRYLTQLGLVARGREPGERRDHYQISSDMWYEVVARRDAILARWEQGLDDGIPPAGPRAEKTRHDFDSLRQQAPQVMAKWREQRAAQRAE